MVVFIVQTFGTYPLYFVTNTYSGIRQQFGSVINSAEWFVDLWKFPLADTDMNTERKINSKEDKEDGQEEWAGKQRR